MFAASPRRVVLVALLLAGSALALTYDPPLSAYPTTAPMSATKIAERLSVARAVRGRRAMGDQPMPYQSSLADLGVAPDFDASMRWYGSAPLRLDQLRGNVIALSFWSFGCDACERDLNRMQKIWHAHRSDPLVLIGVHTPAFTFEQSAEGVTAAIDTWQLDFPVVLDDDYAIWKSYKSEYWPSLVLIDAKGHIRYRHDGEGGYEQAEEVVQDLLMEIP